MQNSIALDWCQLRVTVPFINYQTIKPECFEIRKDEVQTQQFRALYHIHEKDTGEEVAVLVAEPRNNMCLRENDGIIKIANKYLYQKNFYHFVVYLLKDLELIFENIVRLDIAYDFLKFDSMECREFVENFRADTFLKSYKCKYRDSGESRSVEKGKLTGGCESIKFGMETSEVSYQLYNKSLEMQQKKLKPWILEHWQKNGYDGKSEVWRLEFNLTSTSKGIVFKDGEILSFKDLQIIDRIEDIYSHCFSKHFQFVFAELTRRGNYRKQSRCTPVVLFEKLVYKPVTIKLSNKKDSGRSGKIFAKNLMKLNQELRGQDFDLAIMGNELMTWVIKTRSLEEWAKKKLPGIHYSDRVLDAIEKGRNSQLQAEMGKVISLPAKYKSQAQQSQDLQNTIDLLMAKKFAIIPDGMLVNYDNSGKFLGLVATPF